MPDTRHEHILTYTVVNRQFYGNLADLYECHHGLFPIE
jgi:hypothetical protein